MPTVSYLELEWAAKLPWSDRRSGEVAERKQTLSHAVSSLLLLLVVVVVVAAVVVVVAVGVAVVMCIYIYIYDMYIIWAGEGAVIIRAGNISSVTTA